MKIFIMSSLNPWDDIRIFRKEARSLAKRYIVELHIPSDFKYREIDNVRIYGIKKYDVNKRLLRPITWIKLMGRALKSDADAYHFHNPELIPLGIIIKLLKRKPVIYDIHEDFPKAILSKSWIPKYLRKYVSIIFNKLEVYCVNHIFTKSIVTTSSIGKRFNKEKILKIENYAPLMDVKKRQSKPFKSTYEIIFTGSITRIRGVEQSIYAVSELSDKVRLVFLGVFESQEYYCFIKNLIKDQGISNVEILSPLPYDQMISRMAEADIGIIPYLPVENHLVTLPNKLFEYMACSLPIIASNFPLYREIIGEAGCGVFCDPTNPKSIAESIKKLISDNNLLISMGQEGNKKYKAKYNWNLEEIKLLNEYESIFGKKFI